MPFTYKLFPVCCKDLLCITGEDGVWIIENEIERWLGFKFLHHLKSKTTDGSLAKIELPGATMEMGELALLNAKALLDFFTKGGETEEAELTAPSGRTCDMLDPSIPF